MIFIDLCKGAPVARGNKRKGRKVNNKNVDFGNRKHRTESVWEITYDKNFQYSQNPNRNLYQLFFEEITDNSVDRFNKLILNFDFHNKLKKDNGESLRQNILSFNKITFIGCDIFGCNKEQRMSFSDCNFENVHFGYSNLLNVKFSNCSFEKCSFGLSSFEYCVFDTNCCFKNNSIGTGIKFYNTSINASKFISGAYLNSGNEEYMKENNKNLERECYLESKSLAKLSRRILMSLSNNDDDELYYNSLKTFYLCKIKEKKSKQIYEIKIGREKLNNCKKSKGDPRKNDLSYYKKCKIKGGIYINIFKSISTTVEKVSLIVFGSINSWGASLSRCFGVGFLLIALFSVIYWWFFGVDYSLAIVQSIDITFLAGYTKHIQLSSDILLQWVSVINLLVGLVWYAITIPTLIGKIGTSRL